MASTASVTPTWSCSTTSKCSANKAASTVDDRAHQPGRSKRRCAAQAVQFTCPPHRNKPTVQPTRVCWRPERAG